MNDFLNYLSTIAQILGLPIAIISIAVSIWLYQKSKQRRELSCTINPIISPIEIKAGDAIKGEIEIRYKGETVQNLFIVRVHLKNTGNAPIRKAEVVQPVTFIFGKETEFLREPRTITEIPPNLNSKWNLMSNAESKTPNIAYLEFDLLNPGWETSAEFLCTGKSSLPSISAKIEGVPDIGQIDFEEQRIRQRMKVNMYPSFIGGFIGLALFTIIFAIGETDPSRYYRLLWLFVGSAGFMIVFYFGVGYSLLLIRRLSKSKEKERQSKPQSA